MSAAIRGRLLTVLAAAALSLAVVAPGASAALDPLFSFKAAESPKPGGEFNGPCGLTVDISGNFYVADYYHHAVNVYSPTRAFVTQRTGIDPLGGPCGLALDSSGRLFVNDYHRDVIRYTPSSYPLTSTPATAFSGPVSFDVGTPETRPTGVAVNRATNNVYVNRRTHLATYSEAGAPISEIGLGSLVDGYGLAISEFPATAGYLYVPDAASDTVKIYNPLVDLDDPVATIAGPPGGFEELSDSAVAVDRVSGDVYVADQAGPRLAERPESTIEVFSSIGVYKGHLKYNVIDAVPVGLAVDNSAALSQGRIYVTSGNTSGARIYAYSPPATTGADPLPAPAALPATAEAPDKAARATEPSAGPPVPATASEAVQNANVLLDVSGDFSPQKLPRKGDAPIAVSVGWKIATTDGAPPPKLKTMKIEINRAGRFDLKGLPTCPYDKIQPASTSRALSNCRDALVGRGSFAALIGLAGQESYVAEGEMLVFNGLQGKQPVLLGQIYSPRPFASSFVITFKLDKIKSGRYGTSLTATIPGALRAWGSLTEIQMRLKRSFGYKGKQHSFLSAGCPAPKGFSEAPFPLARTSFSFVEGLKQSLTLNRSCKAG